MLESVVDIGGAKRDGQEVKKDPYRTHRPRTNTDFVYMKNANGEKGLIRVEDRLHIELNIWDIRNLK